MKDNNWFIDLDEKEYHAGALGNGGAFMSSHNLALMRDNPRTFELLMKGRLPRTESPALAFGRALHCFTLEPTETWNARYLVSDGPINEKTGAPYGHATAKYAQFLAEQTKEIVSTHDFGLIEGMAESVWSHKEAHELLAEGEPERTIRLEEGEVDVPSQARIDWFNPNYGIVDLKSTGDDIRWFSKAAHDFGYCYQAAWYRKLLELKSGRKYPTYLIAVEKKAPFTVGVFRIADDVLDQAEAINRETLREFANCRDSGVFPTRFEETQLIDRL